MEGAAAAAAAKPKDDLEVDAPSTEDIGEDTEEEGVDFEEDQEEDWEEDWAEYEEEGRLSSTKYDFVKVKVHLEDHYYILSRFIVSRTLTLTHVNPEDAIKISLQLKKELVDQGKLETTQEELEAQLFKIMESKGYGAIYRDRFRMVLKFHHQRVPLIILIAGTGCTGKSFLATQLAQRINLPNVLQTNLVYEFLEGMKSTGAPPPLPVPYRKFDSQRELLLEYKKTCEIVRGAVKADLEKALKEGKSIILEGMHIDPVLYLELIRDHNILEYNLPDPAAMHDIDLLLNQPQQQEEAAKSSSPSTLPKKKGVIIPFVFKMKEKEHRLFVENWLSCSANDRELLKTISEDTATQTKVLLSNLRYIQDFLCKYAPPFQKVEVKAQSFPETLDHLHSVVLEGIQQAYEYTSAFKDS
ncbi:2-phosphoglycerate kinase [Balamuthia mandrillaris]